MYNFISGEKIQSKCLTILFNKSSNPKIEDFNCIKANEINDNCNNPYNIFCYSDHLNHIDYLISILLKLNNKFILVFHNSDYNFNSQHLILFQKIPNLQRIYTQNCSIIDDNVEPIPIGIANEMWKHGNLNILNEVIKLNIPKTKHIYFNFDINTNKTKRTNCKSILINKNIPWIDKKDFKNYLIELSSHYYAICPDGNGLDTHRLWECFYLNVIPICLKNSYLEYFQTQHNFEMILLDDWNDLDQDKLHYKSSKNNIIIEKYEHYLWNKLTDIN